MIEVQRNNITAKTFVLLLCMFICKKDCILTLNNIIWHQQSCKQEKFDTREKVSKDMFDCPFLCQSEEKDSFFLFLMSKGII